MSSSRDGFYRDEESRVALRPQRTSKSGRPRVHEEETVRLAPVDFGTTPAPSPRPKRRAAPKPQSESWQNPWGADMDAPIPLRPQRTSGGASAAASRPQRKKRPQQGARDESGRSPSSGSETERPARKPAEPSKHGAKLAAAKGAVEQQRKKTQQSAAPKKNKSRPQPQPQPAETGNGKGAGKQGAEPPSNTRTSSRISAWKSDRRESKEFAKKTFCWVFKGLVCVIVSIVMLIAITQGSIWVYKEVRTSELFLVKHVDVAGNFRLSKKEILDLAQVREGMNTFDFGVVEVERGLCRTPWIESASVRRILPDKLAISVRERIPSFWLVHEGRTFYATDEGRAIAPVDGANFLSLPVLTMERGGEDLLPFLKLLLRDMRSGRLPVEADAVSSVNLSLGKGIEMYLGDRGLQLCLGSDDWEGNLLRMGVVIADLAKRQELHFTKEIHAAEGNVWVLKRKI